MSLGIVHISASLAMLGGNFQTAIPSGAGAGAESDAGFSFTPWPRHRGQEFRPVVNH